MSNYRSRPWGCKDILTVRYVTSATIAALADVKERRAQRMRARRNRLIECTATPVCSAEIFRAPAPRCGSDSTVAMTALFAVTPKPVQGKIYVSIKREFSPAELRLWINMVSASTLEKSST